MKFLWRSEYIEGCGPCSEYFDECCFSADTTLEITWTCDCLSLDDSSLCGDYDRVDVFPLVSITAITGGFKFRWELTTNSELAYVEFYASTDYLTENSDSARTGQWKFDFPAETLPNWDDNNSDYFCSADCSCDLGSGCVPVPYEFGSLTAWGDFFFQTYGYTWGASVSKVADIRVVNCDGSNPVAGANDWCEGFAIGWKV